MESGVQSDVQVQEPMPAPDDEPVEDTVRTGADIRFRMRRSEFALIKQAADREGRKATNFIAWHALEEAKRILRQAELGPTETK